jgi:DNA polymerase/3'-5' exonuclease PolX
MTGIGKNTAKIIQEFLDTDKLTSPYLEKLKKETEE